MVLSGARKDGSEGRSDKVLELINVEEEVLPLTRGKFLSREHHLVKLRHEERAQKMGVLFTNKALGEFDEEDLALIQNVIKAEAAFLLSDDISYELWPKKRIKSSENGSLRTPP
jgi:hypothetical protein